MVADIEAAWSPSHCPMVLMVLKDVPELEGHYVPGEQSTQCSTAC